MDIKKFITGGNATFTLKSLASGGHFTYRVSAVKNDSNKFFVSILSGPDNTRDYAYAGLLATSDFDGFLAFRTTAKSKWDHNAPSVKGFAWMVNMLNNGKDITKQAEVHHMGKCGRCARALTVPESIESGFGPTCATMVGS